MYWGNRPKLTSPDRHKLSRPRRCAKTRRVYYIKRTNVILPPLCAFQQQVKHSFIYSRKSVGIASDSELASERNFVFFSGYDLSFFQVLQFIKPSQKATGISIVGSVVECSIPGRCIFFGRITSLLSYDERSGR